MVGISRTSVKALVVALGCVLFLGGMAACAKSKIGAQSDTDRSDDMDGPSDEGQDEPEPSDDDGDSAFVVPTVPLDEEDPDDDDPPQTGPIVVDPIVVPPPPEMTPPPPPPEWKRAEGSAVLDIEPDQPPSWFIRVGCQKARECDFLGMGLLTQAECEGLWGGSCAPYAALPEEYVPQECIESVEDASCDELPLALAQGPCIDGISRVLAELAGVEQVGGEGDPCNTNLPCGPGRICQATDPATGCGTCAPVGALGDDCSDRPCVGSYCDPATLRCTEFLPAGAPCNGAGRCFSACGPDGKCLGFSTTTQAPPRPCETDDFCSGTRCQDGFCQPPAPLGAACERDGECAFKRCHEGVCAVSASCELPRQGEYCARLQRCAPGLFCGNGLCLGTGIPTHPLGEPCTQAVECESGYCEGQVCARGPAGNPCERDDDCQTQRCVFGLCGLDATTVQCAP